MIASSTEKLTIVILNSQPILRMGLTALLKETLFNYEITGSPTFNDFKYANPLKPDLFIIVVNQDCNEDGIKTVAEIKRYSPSSCLMVYTDDISPEVVLEYLKMDINGYLSKQKDLAELNTCIETILQGKRYISPDLMENLFDFLFQSHKISKKQGVLTQRQNLIANYLVQGLSTTTIAQKTGLHKSTISTFKAAIFDKLGIDNVVKLKEVFTPDPAHV